MIRIDANENLRRVSDAETIGATPAGRTASVVAVAFAGLLGASTATAHETWLLPVDFSPEPGQSIEFRMTSGMGFPGQGSGIDRRRVVESTLHQDGYGQALVPAGGTEGALELSGIPGPGLACAWVCLRSRILEIAEDEDVKHYLEEIGAPANVLAAWRQREAGTIWRESYSKLARTYLRGEDERNTGSRIESCLQEQSEARFEILPLTDPTVLAAGDSLQLQVLFDREPLAGQAVGLMREGADPEPMQRSDAEGRITITPAGPGQHMLYATNLRPAQADDHNWESDFITLTFEVGEP